MKILRNEIAQDPCSENQLLRDRSKDSKKRRIIGEIFSRKLDITSGSEKKWVFSFDKCVILNKSITWLQFGKTFSSLWWHKASILDTFFLVLGELKELRYKVDWLQLHEHIKDKSIYIIIMSIYSHVIFVTWGLSLCG